MRVVTVTWARDDAALVERLQAFDDSITATPWWTATTAEYCAGGACVGPGTAGGHVSIAEAPAAAYAEDAGGSAEVRDWLARKIADATLPAPTPDTLYAVYLPEGVTVTRDGTRSCADFSALHGTLAGSGAGASATYAVIARCGDEQAITTAASHELLESVTDPDIPSGATTYAMTDGAWTLFGSEVADLCDFVGEKVAIMQSGFAVHRSWSNRSARAGHDPCVPALPGVAYFGAAPRQDAVVLKATGDRATVMLDAFSDRATSAWELSLFDTLGLGFELDKHTVNDGDRVTLTVTAKRPVPPQGGAFAIVSRQGTSATHFWWVAVHAR